MAEAKTVRTDVSVEAFLETVPDPRRRADAAAVCAMMARISGYAPRMWGPAIIGFGSYHYRYDSGRQGDMCRIGFSPRKAQLVLYLARGFPEADALLARLGKHGTGAGCLYIKQLGDVDMTALEQLVAASLAHMDASYPR
jgi:hypothetical protein